LQNNVAGIGYDVGDPRRRNLNIQFALMKEILSVEMVEPFQCRLSWRANNLSASSADVVGTLCGTERTNHPDFTSLISASKNPLGICDGQILVRRSKQRLMAEFVLSNEQTEIKT
jgi:hypothetical protein